MNRHATVEELSSLLDRELEVGPRMRVERHLTDCAGCRGRLDGLRSVVSELKRLERVSPPPTLGREVDRRIHWEPEPASPIERLERRLRSIPLQPSVLPVFAFVLALAAIMLFFASGLERQRRGTPVHLEPPEAALSKEAVESRLVAGRTFDMQETMWVEAGVGDRLPVARFHPSDPAAEAWLTLLPDTAELALLGGPVRLLADGQVVELDFEANR